MENKRGKKGISTIVATLMIILLALVAFALIATVITNSIKKGAGTIELSQKCLDVDLRVTKVTPEVTAITPL